MLISYYPPRQRTAKPRRRAGVCVSFRAMLTARGHAPDKVQAILNRVARRYA